MRHILVEALGWASSLVLLATIMRQVQKQWREGSVAGVSHWLFIGQTTASAGFAAYSLFHGSWVFLFTNIALLTSGVVGQVIFLRNRASGQGPSTARPAYVSAAPEGPVSAPRIHD